jgi:hypothetical protein
VYLEVVVLFASAAAQAAATLREAREATKVPEWTLRRWLSWWREVCPVQTWWAQLRARFAPPPPNDAELPRSLLAKLRESGAACRDVMWLAARCLAPGTTRSAIDSARFVREVASALMG